MNYLKGHHLICFEKNELDYFFRLEMLETLDAELQRRGISMSILRENKNLMDEITTVFSSKLNRDKDRIEIFAALYTFLDFYNEGSRVCFVPTQGFNTSKDVINTLAELKDAINEKTLTDFAIFSKDKLYIYAALSPLSTLFA